MVNVICMKWGTRYDAAYVNRLRGMVRRHLVQPHRFVCFTDDTNGLRPEVETRPLPRIEQPQGQEERFWQKLGTFARPLADLSGPTLFLDLDVIITSDIDCFFEQPGEFCIIREWRNDGPPRGNSSVYRFEAGAHVEVLKEFERDPQAVASRCMFDQDFMSATVQPLTFWPDEWCRSFKKHCLAPVPWCYFTVPKIPPRARIIVFHGHPKPVEAARGCLVRGGIKYCRATPWIEVHSRVQKHVSAQRHPPSHYSSLAPFRELFEQGNPILTYHKIGSRPMRVRLKGLYVSAALFRQQLAELKAAGFQNGSLRDCSGPVKPRQIVLTFDDGYVKVLQHAIGALAQTHFNAIQFLPVNFLGKSNEWDVALGETSEPIMDATQIRDWLAAGHDIGSHTLTHPFLTRLAPDQAREEIFASKKKLEDLFGRSIEHFCYPYGDWTSVVRDWVMEAGYRTASTTDFGINTSETSSFALKRITARYRSRSLKGLLKRIGRLRVVW